MLTRCERERELLDSRRAIEAHVGGQVQLFSYPYSDACQRAGWMDGELSSAGYRAAFLCGGGAAACALPPQTPFRIDRIAVGRKTDLRRELPHA